MNSLRTAVPETRSCPHGHVWATVPADKSGCPHCSSRLPKVPLPQSHPHIADLWSPANGYPVERVSTASNRYAWFRCPGNDAGHEHDFVGVVAQVAHRGGTCAVCSGRQIRAGFNDLGTLDPEVAAQWDMTPGVNSSTPQETTPKSHDVIGWRCPDCDHAWTQPVSKRTQQRTCPACSGHALIPGRNDLATLSPDLAATWDVSNDRTPDQVTCGSGYRARWNCPDHPGFIWEATVNNRTNGTGCPVCAGSVVLAGSNDLGTRRPELAAQLVDPSAAERVTVSSGTPLQWQCSVPGHPPYTASPYSRVAGTGCPVCAGKKVVAGINDFASADPDATVLWSSRNEVSPTEVTPNSTREVWWRCPVGHPDYLMSARHAHRGYRCPVCSNREVLPGVNDLATLRPQLAAQWDDPRDITTVSVGADYLAGWRCPEGHHYTAYVYARAGGNMTGCPHCVGHISVAETELADFVRSILPEGTEVRIADRRIIAPRELDIVVPSRRVAVEFNGVLWHSEAYGKAQEYHRDKYRAASQAGYRLIQVWEDDWKVRQDTVKSMIRTALGRRSERRVGARTTSVRRVSAMEAAEFLDQHHIQGAVPGSRFTGLQDAAGNLVAVMGVRRSSRKDAAEWRIERYATACNVPGGFTRLLSRLRRELEELGGGRVVTFSDNTVSSGAMYAASGFAHDGELEPDYSYAVRGRRVHKFNYRLHRFRDDPALEYQEGLTEQQLADLNGLSRVWDAGKVRWVMDVPAVASR